MTSGAAFSHHYFFHLPKLAGLGEVALARAVDRHNRTHRGRVDVFLTMSRVDRVSDHQRSHI